MRLSEHRDHIVVVSPNPNSATTLLGLLLISFCLVPLSQPHSLMHGLSAAVFVLGGLAWLYRGWPRRQPLERDAKGNVRLGSRTLSPSATLVVRSCAQSGRFRIDLEDNGEAQELGGSRSVQRVSQVAVQLSRWLQRPLRFDTSLTLQPASVVASDAAVVSLAVPPPVRRLAWAAIVVTLLLGIHTLYQLDTKVAELGMAHPLSLTLAWGAILTPLAFGAVLLRRQVRIDHAARWIEWRVFGVPWVRRSLPAVLPQQLAWLRSSADVLHCVVLWPKDALVLSVDASDAPRLAACFEGRAIAKST